MKGREMKDEGKKNICFILYITAILVLAIVYFTVPERKTFFDFQIKWWSEMWDVITGKW